MTVCVQKTSSCQRLSLLATNAHCRLAGAFTTFHMFIHVNMQVLLGIETLYL